MDAMVIRPAGGASTETKDVEVAVIPEPKGLPLVGNIFEIDTEFPLGSFKAMADQYGDFDPLTTTS